MTELYSNKFYNKYSKNIFSQNGEDGILEELLKRQQIELHEYVISMQSKQISSKKE